MHTWERENRRGGVKNFTRVKFCHLSLQPLLAGEGKNHKLITISYTFYQDIAVDERK